MEGRKLVSLFSWFHYNLSLILVRTLDRRDFFGIFDVLGFGNAEHFIKHGICLETYDVILRGFPFCVLYSFCSAFVKAVCVGHGIVVGT